jgi:multiple sugar transport system permease protein
MKKSEVFLYIIMIISTILIIAPFLWLVKLSLSPDIRSVFRSEIIFDHYIYIFSGAPLIWIKNSLIVAFGGTLIVFILSLLGGYALERYEFRGKGVGGFYMALTFIPTIAILVPLLGYMATIKLYNTLYALIIVSAAFNTPFSTWLMKSVIHTMPREIEEAAMLDGCSPFKVLYKFVIPVCASGIAFVFTYTFIMIWNSYAFAFALVPDPDLKILPVGLLGTMQGDPRGGIAWTEGAAMGIIMVLPTIIVFSITQKWVSRIFKIK